MTNRIVQAMETLRHMLGAEQHIPKRHWYHRNYFNSPDAGPDVELLHWMEEQGLVQRGRPNYWHATEAGQKAIGMSDYDIKKAKGS